jgi:hypothetical protein
MAELAERRTKAEERKADAMEKIAAFLERPLGNIRFDFTGSDEEEPEDMVSADARADADTREEKEKAESNPPRRAGRQKIIRMIRNMRDNGSTYSQIARHLEEKNVATFSGKGKWHPQTVQKIYQS